MRSKCRECLLAGLECHFDNDLPCSNCIERGFTDVCLAQPEVGLSEPLKKISLHSINCINYFKTSVSQFSSALSAPFFHAYNNPKTIVYLRFLYLPFLLFFPIYYSAQASTVLRCAEECKEEYDEWIAVLDARVVNLDVRLSTATSATLTGSTDGIEMQVIPTQVIAPTFSERDRATPEHIRVPPPYSATQPSSSPLAKPPPPEKVVALKEAWYRYVDSRVVEWKIAATTACVFVAASPTIFQIPDASDDPVTRSIAFFALCRALSGIIYGPIFPIYFRTARAKSAHFAMMWAQDAKSSQDRFFRGQWIMLSLPAVATSWATISFMLAVFAYIWRTGSVADPSDWPSAVSGRQPMSIDLALVLRIVITSITVIDIACMAWIWRVLRSYNMEVWRDEDGRNAFPVSPRPHGRFGNLTP